VAYYLHEEVNLELLHYPNKLKLLAVDPIYGVILYLYLLSFRSFNNITLRIFNYFICFCR